MQTLTRVGVLDLSDRTESSNRYWETFTADGDGESQDAFEVFVADDNEKGEYFRTLVWESLIRPQARLADAVNFFFRAALDDADFSVLNSSTLERVEAVVSTGVADTEVSTSIKSPDNFSQFAAHLESLEISELQFARLDFQSRSGEISFSYESCDNEFSECSLLLEAGLEFQPVLLNNVLLTHALGGLRNPDRVNTSELLQFLNLDWRS